VCVVPNILEDHSAFTSRATVQEELRPTHRMTKCHMPEDLNLQQHHCERTSNLEGLEKVKVQFYKWK